MQCCSKCFQDRGLSTLIEEISTEAGRCPTCESDDQALVDAVALGDYFEPLCGIYVSGEEGKVLVDWLIEDWQIFHINRESANMLLVEILDDGERVRQNLVPSARCETDRLDRWQQLRSELRHSNRFFPETEFEHERLRHLLAYLVVDIEEVATTWFRARIQRGASAYLPEQMGAPPEEHTTHGRANPAGIPYLYLGSKPKTAVAEVRPHPGEDVSVATFELSSDLRVVDLRNPKQLVSPFLLGDEDQIALMRGDIEFLEKLGQELTTPVLPNAAAIDYIPSQYLCEFIKKCKHNGVLYSSSVSDGVNVALFNADRSAGEVTTYTVQKVDVQLAPN